MSSIFSLLPQYVNIGTVRMHELHGKRNESTVKSFWKVMMDNDCVKTRSSEALGGEDVC